MAVIESIFDILYLSIVIGLGVRLLIFKGKESNLVGWMALLLGFGDAFHLIPRVMAHLTPDGFITYERALSWG